MATGFTATELIGICKVTGIDRTTLTERLNLYDSSIDSDDEDAVRTELTRWETAGVEFGNIHPREANKGFELNAGAEKADIRKNIATLLYCTDLISSGSRLVRC